MSKAPLKMKFGIDIPVSVHYDRNTDKASGDEKIIEAAQSH
jgi:hypothetical protein